MIRSFKHGDLERVMEIGNLAWKNIYSMFRDCYGDELFHMLIPNEQIQKGLQIESHVANHPQWVFVCEESGIVVGFITFALNTSTKIGEISNNAVDPRCGLKGIGQQMYESVFKYFREKGMAYATVNTGLDSAHAPARRAYERAGFSICHEEVRYYKKL